jgi:hypothetical protein
VHKQLIARMELAKAPDPVAPEPVAAA